MYNNFYNDCNIKAIYENSRKCIVRNNNGTITEIKEGSKMTLGFDKVIKLVSAAEIKSEHVVVNFFGGAGGVIKLLSLLNPRLLISVDILYPGSIPSYTGWYYITDEMFNKWTSGLVEKGNYDIKKIRWPIFCQLDVTRPYNPFKSSIDRIIIDPPFGYTSNTVLQLNEDTCKYIFFASLDLASKCLSNNGKVICIIPASWVSEIKTRGFHNQTILDEFNSKRNLILLSFSGKKAED